MNAKMRVVALAVSLIVVTACTGGGPRPRGAPSGSVSPSLPGSTSAPVAPGQTDMVVRALFTTMATEGHNPDPTLNGGLGALYINWRHGTNPLVVNIGGGDRASSPSRATNGDGPMTCSWTWPARRATRSTRIRRSIW